MKKQKNKGKSDSQVASALSTDDRVGSPDAREGGGGDTQGLPVETTCSCGRSFGTRRGLMSYATRARHLLPEQVLPEAAKKDEGPSVGPICPSLSEETGRVTRGQKALKSVAGASGSRNKRTSGTDVSTFADW